MRCLASDCRCYCNYRPYDSFVVIWLVVEFWTFASLCLGSWIVCHIPEPSLALPDFLELVRLVGSRREAYSPSFGHSVSVWPFLCFWPSVLAFFALGRVLVTPCCLLLGLDGF